MKKHVWLKLTSERTQPYTVDDISIIIPSTKDRFEKRWKYFWPQYVKRTHPDIINRTYIPCDEEELDFLADVCWAKEGIQPIIFEVNPRWIVPKTIGALDHITTRLTFRLANDILIVRDKWWEPLLKQFNAEEKLQIIGEIQNGQTFPESLEALQRDWEYLKREYPQATTAAVYTHGARLFAQTAVWNAYYRHVLRYTPHNHDELFFNQIARGDGVQFTKFGGINLYLAHVGISNQDFTDEYIAEHIEGRRKELSEAPDKHEFTVV